MTPRHAAAAGAQDASPVDWVAAGRETADHLQQLLRFETVNPPGNELPLARYLESVLVREGIETRLLEPAPGRAAVVARLRSGEAEAGLMLLAHMDVVGVEREHWSLDPFGGEIRDGYVYGRGAIDDKGMLATNLMGILLAKRHIVDAGLPLARDVVFVATSDEEAGGEWGIHWLMRTHPELLRAELAFNEGGRTRIVDGAPLYAAVQCAEKIPYVLRVTARGPDGHASIPLGGNAVFRLGRALARIGDHREPLRLTSVTRRFFSALASVWPHRREAAAMADLVSRDSRRVRRGERILAGIPVFAAVLRTGISATVVSGGMRPNVIPSAVSALLNVRALPGAPIDGVVRRLREVVDDEAVEIEVVERGLDAPPSDFRSPLYQALAAALTEAEPGLSVVPYMGAGATDSARLRVAGVQAFGLLPFPLPKEDEERMHGHDERIALSALAFGTRVTFGMIRRLVVPAADRSAVPRRAVRRKPQAGTNR